MRPTKITALGSVTFSLRKFGGINNRAGSTDIAPDFFTDSLNVDFSTPARLDVRKGYSIFNAVAITGTPEVRTLFRYAGSSVASLFAMCSDGTIRKSQGAGGTFTDSLSGLVTSATRGAIVQFGGRRVDDRTYVGRMFYSDGVNVNKSYSEAEGWLDMGIAYPSTARDGMALDVLYGQGSAGMASGRYALAYTLVNSSKGIESGANPSGHKYDDATYTDPYYWMAPVSKALSASNAGISITFSTYPATGGVTHRKIYRTLTLTGAQVDFPLTKYSGFNYYLATTIPIAVTAVTASANDNELTTNLVLDRGVPPKVKYLAEYQSTLFGAGDVTDAVTKSLVYFSRQLDNSPEEWPIQNYLPVSPDDGDEITLLRRIGDTLVVAKKNQWGVIVGYDESTFRYQPIDTAHGCIAPYSVATTENAIIFLSNDGWRICNGVASQLLCASTMDISQMSLNYAQLDKFQGAYYRGRKFYICGIVTGANTNIDKWVRIQFPDQQWSYDDYVARTALQYYDTSGQEVMYLGNASGQVLTMFGASQFTDNGTAVSYNFTFGPAYMGVLDRVKKFHTLAIESGTSRPTVGIAQAVDGGSLSSYKSVSASTPRTVTGLSKTGRFLNLTVSGQASAATFFNDFEFKANVEPLRRF